MKPKTLTVLGATGSIGQNTLDVVARFPERFAVHALAANTSVAPLLDQVLRFRPRLAVLHDPAAAAQLRDALPGDCPTEVLCGMEGLVQAATAPAVDQVVSGMVGAIGLRPTYAAIDAGKQVAVANKETLVLAGELMVRRAAASGAVLLPMDSEHNAIFQCLAGAPMQQVSKITLTASGGPFRDLPLADFPHITREQALNHPNWDMGPKITIDSATMLNKGLEVIEARWLFGLPPARIDVLIHRQSIVHSMVEFIDGSVIAQLGLPDMRTPIACCLAWPERLPLDLPRLDLAQAGRLDFQPVDGARFPCLFLALRALQLGGGAPAVLNGANEVVVAAYLADAFPFSEIACILNDVMSHLEQQLAGPAAPPHLRCLARVEDAIAADQWGREQAGTLIEERPHP